MSDFFTIKKVNWSEKTAQEKKKRPLFMFTKIVKNNHFYAKISQNVTNICTIFESQKVIKCYTFMAFYVNLSAKVLQNESVKIACIAFLKGS